MVRHQLQNWKQSQYYEIQSRERCANCLRGPCIVQGLVGKNLYAIVISNEVNSWLRVKDARVLMDSLPTSVAIILDVWVFHFETDGKISIYLQRTRYRMLTTTYSLVARNIWSFNTCIRQARALLRIFCSFKILTITYIQLDALVCHRISVKVTAIARQESGLTRLLAELFHSLDSDLGPDTFVDVVD